MNIKYVLGQLNLTVNVAGEDVKLEIKDVQVSYEDVSTFDIKQIASSMMELAKEVAAANQRAETVKTYAPSRPFGWDSDTNNSSMEDDILQRNYEAMEEEDAIRNTPVAPDISDEDFNTFLDEIDSLTKPTATDIKVPLSELVGYLGATRE